jgi:hypothetical protein
MLTRESWREATCSKRQPLNSSSRYRFLISTLATLMDPCASTAVIYPTHESAMCIQDLLLIRVLNDHTCVALHRTPRTARIPLLSCDLGKLPVPKASYWAAPSAADGPRRT